MEQVTLTVNELFILQGQLVGLSLNNYKTGESKVALPGLINEAIPESVKRRAYKAGEIIRVECERINKQKEVIKELPGLTTDGTVTTPEQLAEMKEAKLKELYEDTITIQVEKMLFSKIENLTLQGNYQVAFDKLFIE